MAEIKLDNTRNLRSCASTSARPLAWAKPTTLLNDAYRMKHQRA